LDSINIVEDTDFLNNEQKAIIKEVTLGADFPWYWSDKQTEENSEGYFFHQLLTRPEVGENNESKINSNFYDFFLSLLESFCKKNNIKYYEVLRASVNCVFSCNAKASPIHEDHDFEHNQLIIYLNDSPTSRTLIFDKNNKKIKSVKATQFKGISFPKLPHAVQYPTTKERRVTAIFTFR